MTIAMRILGAAGVLLCLAAVVTVWVARSPVERARQQAFVKVDESFARIDARLVRVGRLAEQSRVTLDDLRQRVAEAAPAAAVEQAAERLQLQSRADQLAAVLRQGQTLLDSSDDVVQYIEQTLQVAGNLGAAVDPQAVAPLREQLGELAEELGDAAAKLETAGNLLSGNADDAEAPEGRRQVVETVGKLVATFGNVDERLGNTRDLVTSSRAAVEKFSGRLGRQLLWTAIVATVIALWMGVGQVCLWRCGRADADA